jgi:hypothetical protein
VVSIEGVRLDGGVLVYVVEKIWGCGGRTTIERR